MDAVAEFLATIVAALPPGETRVVVPMPPCVASRPRVGKFSTYYSGPYGKFVSEAPKVFAKLGMEVGDELGLLVAEHHCPRPKTTKRRSPKGDADNYLKATADALQKAKALYLNDDQCVAMLTTKWWAAPGTEPRIVISWIPVP